MKLWMAVSVLCTYTSHFFSTTPNRHWFILSFPLPLFSFNLGNLFYLISSMLSFIILISLVSLVSGFISVISNILSNLVSNSTLNTLQCLMLYQILLLLSPALICTINAPTKSSRLLNPRVSTISDGSISCSQSLTNTLKSYPFMTKSESTLILLTSSSCTSLWTQVCSISMTLAEQKRRMPC